MKKVNLFIVFTLFLTSCSTKSTTTPIKCQNIQNEIDNLSKEKYRDLAAITTKAVTGSYSYGGKEKNLDQKIQILELKLNACRRRFN